MRAFSRILIFALALFAAGSAAAATHIWALSGVMFDDGATASGTFTYDDVTGAILSQNIRVTDGPFYLGFTYLSGNSFEYTLLLGDPQPVIIFRAPEAGGPMIPRELRITPVSTLNGTASPVALNLATLNGGAGGVECYDCGFARLIVAGSLVLVALPPPVALVQVDEFYNAALDHYFMTAIPAKKNDLLLGVHPGWTPTGHSFKAYAAGSSASGSISPVCRWYGNPSAGLDTHFFSGSAWDCFEVRAQFATAWTYESDKLFQIAMPDTTTGACPGSTIPVYRVWNQRTDSNHRYTISLVTRDAMVAMGYVAEGYGPNAVVMCAVP